jgi:hypothetical protein
MLQQQQRSGERENNDERDTGDESLIPNNALNSTHLPLRHA